MSLVRFLREAEVEFKNAIRFYEENHKGLGDAFAQEIQVCLRRIADMPLASRVERGNIRVRSVARFPYRVYYRENEADILVIAVGHRRQKPGFWGKRV